MTCKICKIEQEIYEMACKNARFRKFSGSRQIRDRSKFGVEVGSGSRLIQGNRYSNINEKKEW